MELDPRLARALRELALAGAPARRAALSVLRDVSGRSWDDQELAAWSEEELSGLASRLERERDEHAQELRAYLLEPTGVDRTGTTELYEWELRFSLAEALHEGRTPGGVSRILRWAEESPSLPGTLWHAGRMQAQQQLWEAFEEVARGLSLRVSQELYELPIGVFDAAFAQALEEFAEGTDGAPCKPRAPGGLSPLRACVEYSPRAGIWGNTWLAYARAGVRARMGKVLVYLPDATFGGPQRTWWDAPGATNAELSLVAQYASAHPGVLSEEEASEAWRAARGALS